MTDVSVAPRKAWYSSLFVQLLVAIVAGIAVGWLWPAFGADLKPLADGFIKLIKMLIAPIIFCTVVIGIAHVGDLKSVGRIGVKALIYFEVVTTFALLFGLVIGNVIKPGSGFNIDPQTLATGAEAVAKKTGDGELPHTVEFILNIIPTSVFSAFAENMLLQVLFFAVLFGLALAKFGEHGPPVVFEMIEHLSSIFFTIIGWIMRLAPVAAFGAMAYIIGQYGISSLGSYAKLIAACYLGAALFILVLAAIAWFLAGVNLWQFVVYIKDELFLALGTASTEVVLPRIILALSATVAAIGHGAIPVAAVALLLGADRIMDSMRVSVNLLGNCVATLVVARWEGQLDTDRMRKVLRGQTVEPLDEVAHAEDRKEPVATAS
jgi:aerobic C4-dicarboxylate transport protein